MPTEILAKYLNAKRVEKGLTHEAIAKVSKVPESTVKNLCTGKTENPQMETVIPVMEAVGGSFDEMLHPEKHKGETSDTSVLALKDIYEYQIATLKKTNEEHIANIRAHYEQHREDVKENYEKRLSDKKEIIGILKNELLVTKIALAVCAAMFVAVLIAELMNPNLGWIKF